MQERNETAKEKRWVETTEDYGEEAIDVRSPTNKALELTALGSVV